MKEPKVLLAYPPLTDPTTGYHSICYLDSYARKHGFDAIDIVDANIEAFHHAASNAPDILTRVRQRAQELSDRETLSADESRELRMAWKAEYFEASDLRQAIAWMRDSTRFYDYSSYCWAAERIIAWMSILSCVGVAGQFTQGFRFSFGNVLSPSRIADLNDAALLERISAPFGSYFDGVLLPEIKQKGYDVVGLSVTYTSQLPFALWLGRRIREALPDVTLLFGGTEVSDVRKFMREGAQLFDVFSTANACVIGDGESAFVRILEDVRAERAIRPSPNVLVNPARRRQREMPVVLQYEPLKELPTPEYGKLPWQSYLSPEPFVYYSPSRGCYWNKCTFCDYSLNGDAPTSPWRQNSVERMVGDVRELSRFAKFIYFAVDVLAPATLLRFAERVVEERIDIRWGAEIRLEKYWSRERCAMLRQSGCIAISVGFESACQRVLDLIDKGTKVEQVRETITNMHSADIGVQMMGFTGFPTETFDEAMESIAFLRGTADVWTFAGLGEYELTPGAIVAKRPADFGIEKVEADPLDDIVRTMRYQDRIGHKERAEEIDDAKGALRRHHIGRPWLGGIDTPHTYFYHDKYGTEIVDVLSQAADDPSERWILNGHVVAVPNPLVKAGPGARNAERLSSPTGVHGDAVFLHADGRVLEYPQAVLTVLQHFETPSNLISLLEDADQELHDGCRAIWRHAVKRRLLHPCDRASSLRAPVERKRGRTTASGLAIGAGVTR